MTLYMTEIAVSDFSASLTWYREGLGLSVILIDNANRFALLGNTSGRLAIKQGNPNPQNVLIHFHVHELDRSIRLLENRGVRTMDEPKSSEEGYRRVKFRDPDGYGIVLFECDVERLPVRE